ncbi:hypothetical protein [Stappia indica]|uniref:hypothetical protein n=1 Tax=Stappia indica TaxID=538381 RepID=UPI00082E81DD|nr:hypothetical protein [Stappia indica]
MEWRLSQTAKGNIKSLLIVACLAVVSYLIFALGKYSPFVAISIFASSYLTFRWIGLCKIEIKYINYKFYSSIYFAIFSIYAFHHFNSDDYPLLNFLYFFFGIGMHGALSLELALGFNRRSR